MGLGRVRSAGARAGLAQARRLGYSPVVGPPRAPEGGRLRRHGAGPRDLGVSPRGIDCRRLRPAARLRRPNGVALLERAAYATRAGLCLWADGGARRPQGARGTPQCSARCSAAAARVSPGAGVCPTRSLTGDRTYQSPRRSPRGRRDWAPRLRRDRAATRPPRRGQSPEEPPRDTWVCAIRPALRGATGPTETISPTGPRVVRATAPPLGERSGSDGLRANECGGSVRASEYRANGRASSDRQRMRSVGGVSSTPPPRCSCLLP